MCFDVLIGTMGSHMSLLSEVKEMIPFGRGEPVSQIIEECCLYLKARNPPIAQVELWIFEMSVGCATFLLSVDGIWEVIVI